MHTPRRAASPALFTAVRTALTLLVGGLALVTGATAFLAVRVARRVVTPAPRAADTEILELDAAAQTITLSRTLDTALPGRYGLFTSGAVSYLKLGSVLSEDDTSVKRKLLTHIGRGASLGRGASFSGWYYDRPEQLQLPFSAELIGSALGPCPAWLFPAEGPADTWVIQVHGRGATRAECLRAVPVFRDVGVTSLVVSYRNDGEGPRTRAGTYALGSTEWRDVEAAIGFARRRGARRVLLMGWSMGGAIALQLALSSAHREAIAGVVLESPVVDWRVVLDYQARSAGIGNHVAGLAISTLGASWATRLTHVDAAIPFDRLDIVARAGELRHPVLILHSDDDGFVPSDASHDLVVARPDLVSMQVFEVARHTKLWNYDQARWSGAITDWLAAHGLSAAGSSR